MQIGEPRPRIDLQGCGITHNGKLCRVVLRPQWISVACSDVTPAALKHLLTEWEKNFGEARKEVVLQP